MTQWLIRMFVVVLILASTDVQAQMLGGMPISKRPGSCSNQGTLDSQDLDCDGIINLLDFDDDNDGILDLTEMGGLGVGSSHSLTGVTGTLLGSPNNFAIDNNWWTQHGIGSATFYSNRELIGMTFPEPTIVTSMTFNHFNNQYLQPGSVVRFEGSNDGTNWNSLAGNVSIPGGPGGWNPTFTFSQNLGAYRFYRIFAVSIQGVDGGVLHDITMNAAMVDPNGCPVNPDPNASNYVMSGAWPGLNSPQLTSGSSWSGADNTSTTQFVGMRFSASKIGGVAIRGRGDAAQWVTSFQLQATKNGTTWVSLGTFTGNSDQHTTVFRAVNNPDTDWVGLRINPLAWNGHPSLRFQFSLSVGCDLDNDGIANSRDTDSDNDGCLDALEGSMRFKQPDILVNRLTGGVNAFGVPLLATASGQGILDSQNSAVNACTRVDWTAATLTSITSTGTATLINATTIKVVMNYTTDALQTVTLPPGATAVQVKAWGAGGARGNQDGPDWGYGGWGGGGAYSTTTAAVAGGNLLQVYVANGGTSPPQPLGKGGNVGGWGYCNGAAGGACGPSGYSGSGGGGGGSSAVVNTSTNSVVIVAGGGGGGGGGGYNSDGGGGAGGGVSSGNSVCHGATGGSHPGDGGGGGGGGGGYTNGGVGGGVAGGDNGAGGGGGGNSLGTVTNGSNYWPGNSGDPDRCASCGLGNGGKGQVVLYITQP